jgi:hypothetical protein
VAGMVELLTSVVTTTSWRGSFPGLSSAPPGVDRMRTSCGG